ncbi:MAG: UV DNA damage repair endonuclease UvsE [Bacillota bacterium]|nr:UV DNA damage repair endonuclease UvsE [Bacillota bacterium]
MRIRFGFVAMSLKLPESSPSKTITVTNFKKLPDNEVKLYRLHRLAKENLTNSLRILRHAVDNGIYIYRFTSKLIPLATHPIAEFWDWQQELRKEFAAIGEYIKANNIRVSAHPDHFTVLNSPKEDVLAAAIKDLSYHHDLFEAMGLGEEAKLVIHLGGAYKNKQESIARFIKNFSLVPNPIGSRVILENDDKSYNAEEVLLVCESLGIPMVLDLHHHQFNASESDLKTLLPRIFATWQGTGLVPKLHLSSPKSPEDFRSHADDIDPSYFLDFLKIAKSLDVDFDVMLEAKNKDLALFNLMKKLKKVPDITFETDAIIKY